MESIKLKVAQAIIYDINKGIVRIDPGFTKQIGVKAGSVIEIEGKRILLARVLRAYPGDVGLRLIRMDRSQMQSVGAGIGDMATVRKATAKEWQTKL